MRMADCHPDRKHFCKGLCTHCYRKASKPRERTNYNKKYHADHQVEYRRYQHQFTTEDEIRFVATTICDWCGLPLRDESPHIDHDHHCCRTDKHCENCTRGFVHPRCNTWAINYFEWQEREFGVTDPRLADYRRRFPVPRVAGLKDPQERPAQRTT